MDNLSEWDVFLSHSSKDKATVRDVAERLRADGIRVWFDEWEILPGDHILARIEDGLEHSRRLVLCMSANAFGSDWAQLEGGVFRFNDPLNRQRRLVPLRLDESPIKDCLAPFLYISWLPADREQQYPRLLEACRPQTVPAPEQPPGPRKLAAPVTVPAVVSTPAVAASIDDVPPALLALLLQSKVTPFVGAGISMAAPTSLPSAPELARDLIASGYGKEGDDLEEIAERCWATNGNGQLFATALPISDWRNRRTNVCHQVLAELAAEGLVHTILTTNWDTCLESAMHEVGVQFSPLRRTADLAVAAHGVVRVGKLHGCIEDPGTIVARRTEVDSAEWGSEWAEALTLHSGLSDSLLFVGYSGASRAATGTIGRIRREPHSAGLDWVVDYLPRDAAEGRERPAGFLAALRVGADKYIESDAGAFFWSLRHQVFPLLLSEPRRRARVRIEKLFQPTHVNAAGVLGAAERVEQAWVELGQVGAQVELQSCVPSRMTAPSRYIPILGLSHELGAYWSWIAMLVWAGAGQIELCSDGVNVTVAGGGTHLPVVPVLCEGTERRDEACAITLSSMAKAPSPSIAYIGVVVGGQGPITGPARRYSMVRGLASANVARGGEVRVAWQEAGTLFNVVTANADEGPLAQTLQRTAANYVAQAMAGVTA